MSDSIMVYLVKHCQLHTETLVHSKFYCCSSKADSTVVRCLTLVLLMMVHTGLMGAVQSSATNWIDASTSSATCTTSGSSSSGSNRSSSGPMSHEDQLAAEQQRLYAAAQRAGSNQQQQQQQQQRESLNRQQGQQQRQQQRQGEACTMLCASRATSSHTYSIVVRYRRQAAQHTAEHAHISPPDPGFQ
jgi:hypothetical protein